MNQRKMKVNMIGKSSKLLNLIGGGPQGSILGQLLFIIGRDDAAEEVEDEDKFNYIDNLVVTEVVQTEDKLQEYDIWKHVPSDVGTGQKFLAPTTLKS